jgi:hypothetical protein
MMTCRQCAELLLDFLSGELDEVLAETIRQHLMFCGPCETYVATYQITITLTRQLRDKELPEGLAERLWQAMKQAEEP